MLVQLGLIASEPTEEAFFPSQFANAIVHGTWRLYGCIEAQRSVQGHGEYATHQTLKTQAVNQ